MFCTKCGLQVADTVIFCPRCGTKLQENGELLAVREAMPESKELDRTALQIYLGDVLNMECIVGSLESRIEKNRKNSARIKNNNYYKCYTLDKSFRERYLHFLYDGNDYYTAWIKHCPSGNPIYGIYMQGYLDPDGHYFTYKWVDIDVNMKLLKSPKTYDHATGSSCLFFEKWDIRSAARDAFMDCYRQFKDEAPSGFRRNLEAIQNYETDTEGAKSELLEAKTLRDKAYSLNIIPQPFRYNLYAIYFLYDFISTSKESFTTALLHCDLDEIKKKLDKIIEQQRAIIIQQATLAAQNAALLRQNQEQLNHLERIEKNTDRSAQYAAIAANNAETCAWIGLANYISSNN